MRKQHFIVLTCLFLLSASAFLGCDSGGINSVDSEQGFESSVPVEKIVLDPEWEQLQFFQNDGPIGIEKGGLDSGKFRKAAHRFLAAVGRDQEKLDKQLQKFLRSKKNASDAEKANFAQKLLRKNAHVVEARIRGVAKLTNRYPDLQPMDATELSSVLAHAAAEYRLEQQRSVGKAEFSEGAVGYSPYNCDQCEMTYEFQIAALQSNLGISAFACTGGPVSALVATVISGGWAIALMGGCDAIALWRYFQLRSIVSRERQACRALYCNKSN